MIQFLTVIEWIKAMSCDHELSAGALRTGIHLAVTMNRKTGQCSPSIKTIAELTGQSQRTVERATSMLANTGWIEVASTVGGRGKTCQYTLINPVTGDIVNRAINPVIGDGDNAQENPVTDDVVSENKPRHPCQETPSSVSRNPVIPDAASNEGNRGIEPGYRTGGESAGKRDGGILRAPIPHDFIATKAHRDYAKIHMLPDPEDCLLVFINHHQSRGTLSANWDAEFRKWLVNEKRFKRPSNGPHHKSSSHESYAERLDRAEAIVLGKAGQGGDGGDQAAVLGDEEQLPAPVGAVVQK